MKFTTDNIDIWDSLNILENQKLFGMDIPPGTTVNRLEAAEHNNSIFLLPAIHFWKMFLEMGSKFEDLAIEFSEKLECIKSPERTIDKKRKYKIYSKNSDDMKQYFKFISAAFIFSYCALEAYTNQRIDSFIPSETDYLNLDSLIKKNSMNSVVNLKKDLLKECSLYEKLFIVLPFSSRKRNILLDDLKQFEESFNKVTYVRNSLIHETRLKNRSYQDENGRIHSSKMWNLLIPHFKTNKTGLRIKPNFFVNKVIAHIESVFCKKQLF